jgi:SAM-dependent methyltransferase
MLTSDPRDTYIRRVVRDKSFADVGGLWGTVNEKVSVAHKCGASALAMVDVSPPEHELWHLFEERRQALGLPEVQCISADALTIANTSPAVQFDVVHCSGVLYHMPDPMRLLVSLRKISREYLVLASSVTGTRVNSNEGVLRVPQGAALFIPALQSRESAILRSYWQQFVGDAALGLTRDVPSWRIDDYGPWWWLPTVDALKAMCEVTGFHCEGGAYLWNDNAYVLLLSVVE